MKTTVYILLDNIRSAHNVGSIFRTADGAGVEKIYLSGYTPAPKDRFGRVQAEIKKTSLGASETVAWEKIEEKVAGDELAKLKAEGFYIVAVEQTPKSISLFEFDSSKHPKICYIFGNEIDGVREDLLEFANAVIEIPMQGKKESLNVSVSVGIVLYI